MRKSAATQGKEKGPAPPNIYDMDYRFNNMEEVLNHAQSA